MKILPTLMLTAWSLGSVPYYDKDAISRVVLPRKPKSKAVRKRRSKISPLGRADAETAEKSLPNSGAGHIVRDARLRYAESRYMHWEYYHFPGEFVSLPVDARACLFTEFFGHLRKAYCAFTIGGIYRIRYFCFGTRS